MEATPSPGSLNPKQHRPPLLQEVRRLSGHTWETFHLRFSPDGLRLLVGSDRGKVLLWEVWSQKVPRYLDAHPHPLGACAFSPNGELIALAGEDGAVRVWTHTGEPLVTLPGHQPPATGVAFSPHGTRLWTGEGAGRILVWDWAAERVLASVPILSTAQQDQVAHLAAAHPRKMYWTQQGVFLYGIALSPDGTQLAVSCNAPEGLLQVWSVPPDQSAAVLLTTLLPSTEGLLSAPPLFSSTGRWLALLLTTKEIEGIVMYDTQTWHHVLTIQGPFVQHAQSQVRAMAWAPDGRQLAFAEVRLEAEQRRLTGWLWVWDVEHNTPTAAVMVFPDVGAAQVWPITAVDWDQTGTLIATGGYETGGASFEEALMVKLWEVQDTREAG